MKFLRNLIILAAMLQLAVGTRYDFYMTKDGSEKWYLNKKIYHVNRMLPTGDINIRKKGTSEEPVVIPQQTRCNDLTDEDLQKLIDTIKAESIHTYLEDRNDFTRDNGIISPEGACNVTPSQGTLEIAAASSANSETSGTTPGKTPASTVSQEKKIQARKSFEEEVRLGKHTMHNYLHFKPKDINAVLYDNDDFPWDVKARFECEMCSDYQCTYVGSTDEDNVVRVRMVDQTGSSVECDVYLSDLYSKFNPKSRRPGTDDHNYSSKRSDYIELRDKENTRVHRGRWEQRNACPNCTIYQDVHEMTDSHGKIIKNAGEKLQYAHGNTDCSICAGRGVLPKKVPSGIQRLVEAQKATRDA